MAKVQFYGGLVQTGTKICFPIEFKIVHSRLIAVPGRQFLWIGNAQKRSAEGEKFPMRTEIISLPMPNTKAVPFELG